MWGTHVRTHVREHARTHACARARTLSLSLSQSIFTDFAVPVYLLQLIGVVIYFICLYIVYHV